MQRQASKKTILSPIPTPKSALEEKKQVAGDDNFVMLPETKEDEKSEFVDARTVRMVSTGFVGGLYRTKLCIGVTCSVNASAGKFKQGIANGATSIAWNSIGSAAEFSALDQIFDEFFIHSVKLRYIPRNKYSAQSTATSSAAGSPGDLNTIAATVYCLLHGATDYSDNSSGWFNAANSRHHKFVDMGSSWSMTVANPEKYSPKGALGDMSTGSSTMAWCQTTASSKYGGFFGLLTPVASGASVGIGTLLEGGVFGDILVEYDISFRARA